MIGNLEGSFAEFQGLSINRREIEREAPFHTHLEGIDPSGCTHKDAVEGENDV